MNKVLLLSLCLLTGYYGISQNLTEDVVYLKNGSIIRGTIIEYNSEKIIKIETHCRNTWVFNADEVLKMVKEEYESDINTIEGKNNGERKYKLIIDGAILLGESNASKDIPISFNFINEYKFKSWLMAGIGTGIEFFEQKVAPVFIDTKILSNSYETTPFIGLQVGYAFPIDDNQEWYNSYPGGYGKGGLLYNAGLGILLNQNETNAISFSFSYRYQRLNYHKYADWSNTESDIQVNYNRFAIRFGVSF